MASYYQDDVEVVYEKLNERVQDLRYEVSSLRTKPLQPHLIEGQFCWQKSGCNPLIPNINMYILSTILCMFIMGLVERICLSVNTCYLW